MISKFALFSDTHSDSENTAKALVQAKEEGAGYIVHSGDWSKVGTLEELKEQRELLSKSKLPFWGVLGDHDLWQSGTENFREVFGYTYTSFDKNGVHHILLDSSDTSLGLGEKQLSWLEEDLKVNAGKITFIFMHLPPYNPYNARTIWEKGGSNSTIKGQVDKFLKLIKGKVAGIFSGDQHFSSSYTEPASHVKITIVGAVTGERNLQQPRFDIVEVYDSGEFRVSEEIIK
ncbi:MAG: metallophosphoesterase [bacterium]|nr:metallophosphoesterase [bacterium]